MLFLSWELVRILGNKLVLYKHRRMRLKLKGPSTVSCLLPDIHVSVKPLRRSSQYGKAEFYLLLKLYMLTFFLFFPEKKEKQEETVLKI